jgi:hypothetical protein
VYLYQIINYSMQQVFIWSQFRTFPSSTLTLHSVIGHNSFSISTSADMVEFKPTSAESADYAELTVSGSVGQENWPSQ